MDNEVNFSTSYDFSLLQNTDKLLPEELRNQKNTINDKPFYDNKSENESISNYVSPVQTQTQTMPSVKQTEQSFFKPMPEPKKQNIQSNEDDFHSLPKNEQYKKKLDLFNDMADMAMNGTVFSQKYSIHSDYDMMKYELELHRKNKAKTQMVNWASGLLYSIVEGIEYFSEESFSNDYKLTGWSDRINMRIGDVNDLIGQIITKHNKDGKEMSPELLLLFILGGSAISTIHDNRPKKERYTPEEIEKLREKSIQDALRKSQLKDKEMKKTNDQAIEKMNHYEKLKKIKEDMDRQEQEQLKIVQQFETSIMDSPQQDELYLSRQKQLDEMRNNLNKISSDDTENKSEKSENSNKGSKKTTSMYTKGGTKKKGIKMNF